MDEALRVAFFPDTYHEVDGVANTCRQYESFAIRRALPFLTVHGGHEDTLRTEGSGIKMERRRGPIGFAVDKKHSFDLAFLRHYRAVENAVRKFAPDVIHITGPSDVGILGATIADRLRIPLAASWHTNLHQYAEERACALAPWLPRSLKGRIGGAICRASLFAALRYYRLAQILFAPNQELTEILEAGTSKRCYLMQRGVDTVLFDPKRRDSAGDAFTLGYVGRLTTEKNVHLLAEVESILETAGMRDFRFVIVGQGAEEKWLKRNLRRAEFAGVLKGEALARAYANMDLFIFPSRTDTFGNVVLEALASGVPAIVTDGGGPRFVIRAGETGFVARDAQEFARYILHLAQQPGLLPRMREAARSYATSASWDSVFEAVYAGYERGLKDCAASGKKIRMRSGPRICAGASI